MRQLAALLLAALLLQGAYTVPAQPPEPSGETVIRTTEETAADLARTILDSQPDGADYRLLPAEDTEIYLTELYGIPEGRERTALIYAVGGVDAREIAVVYVAGGGMEEGPAAGLEEYRQDRYRDFCGYVPQAAELVEKGLVLENGGWSVLLLCSEPEKAKEALDRDWSHLALWPYDPDEEVYDWTQYYDARGYRRFVSPGKVDMTLYDTSAIRAAYASGDRGDYLSEKDAAILKKCREILDSCVRSGMTDFEKELAIHDWLVDHCGYDLTARYSLSATGRPDNKNPYGLLVEGYGVCLGYATSFQLLMDLAGVECITVVGASASSARDHAWNMVKLEGEWYCVDLTWDDPVFSGDPAYYPTQWLAERYHKYFNVTSDYMRETDHQWDYDAVPEATAARFRWDGVGEKPV